MSALTRPPLVPAPQHTLPPLAAAATPVVVLLLLCWAHPAQPAWQWLGSRPGGGGPSTAVGPSPAGAPTTHHGDGSGGGGGMVARCVPRAGHVSSPGSAAAGSSDLSSTCTRAWHSGQALTNHEFFTSPLTRRRALPARGSWRRLHAAARRYWSGQELVISFMGGSITAGMGVTPKHNTVTQWVEAILANSSVLDASRIKVVNGAKGGTTSMLGALCHSVFASKDADIVFVEYTLNDFALGVKASKKEVLHEVHNVYRFPVEQLIRSLLQYPKSPAVVLVHSYAWGGRTLGTYFRHGNEREFYELSDYYSLPAVSVKAAAYHLMAAAAPGFVPFPAHLDATRRPRPGTNDSELAAGGLLFYMDHVHPSNTGHQVLAELEVQVVLNALAATTPEAELEAAERGARGGAGAEDAGGGGGGAAAQPEGLPPPMMPEGLENAVNRCLLGEAFKEAVASHDGAWEWVDEGKGPGQEKWGFVATQPGAQLTIAIDTTPPVRQQPPSLPPPPPPEGHGARKGAKGRAPRTSGAPASRSKYPIAVTLSYLHSYAHMGRAKVECTSGCECDPAEFDGHNDHDRTSQLKGLTIYVSEHPRCAITVTVLGDTSSGEHKVKLGGVITAEGSVFDKFGAGLHHAVKEG